MIFITFLEAVVKMNFNTFSTTRRNKYKLQKSSCHYNIRKYSFGSRLVNMWNSLPNDVAEVDTINTIKNRLGKYWFNQDILVNFNADLIGTGSLPICMRK